MPDNNDRPVRKPGSEQKGGRPVDGGLSKRGGVNESIHNPPPVDQAPQNSVTPKPTSKPKEE